MRNLRVLCWAWIVLSTIVILFHAPVSVARKSYGKPGVQATSVEWIGPFKEPFNKPSASVIRSSIDFSRLVVAILAANLLPAVLLWQHDQVVEWLKIQQRQRATSDQSTNIQMLASTRARREAASRRVLVSCIICLLAICVFLVGVLIHNQQSMPTATGGSPADEWVEVRRAIPVK